MSRTSMVKVEYYLNILNSQTKNHYKLYKKGAPTTYQLVLKTEAGGLVDISREGLTLTEVYEVIYAMTNLLAQEKGV